MQKVSWKQAGVIEMMDFHHIQKKFEQCSLKQFSLKSDSLATTFVFPDTKNFRLMPTAVAALLTIYKRFTDRKWRI